MLLHRDSGREWIRHDLLFGGLGARLLTLGSSLTPWFLPFCLLILFAGDLLMPSVCASLVGSSASPTGRGSTATGVRIHTNGMGGSPMSASRTCRMRRGGVTGRSNRSDTRARAGVTAGPCFDIRSLVSPPWSQRR